MIFYRKTLIEAEKKETITDESCPICGGKLSRDFLMPILYSPMTMLRWLLLALAFVVLILLLLLKFEVLAEPFNQLGFDQVVVVVAVIAVCGLIFSFFATLVGLKLTYFSENNSRIAGTRCTKCGNRFAAEYDSVEDDEADQSGSVEVAETIKTSTEDGHTEE